MSSATATDSFRAHDELTLTDWVGFTAMVVGIFMAILDIQIVSSSLQQIQAGLSATQDEIAWVSSSYLIAEVVVIPLSGWLGQALSTRYLFSAAAIGFTVTSALCAFSWNLQSMIVFRCFQGLFGGVMIPTVFSVIYTLFPPRLQPAMTVVTGLVVTIAPTAGPVLGGYLTETFSWQALFLINLVPGLVVGLCTFLFVHVDRPDWLLLRKIDFLGALFVVLFLGSLQYVLEEGVREQWFESPEIVIFSVVACVAFVAMVVRELRIAEPIVDLRAFRDLNFALGCLFSFVLGVGLYTVMYLLPVYLAGIKGLNSLQIGMYLTVTGVAQFLSAALAGGLAKAMDARLMLALGICLYVTGAWMNGQMTAEWGFAEFFWPQALRGISMMFIFLPVNTLALGTLPAEEVKNASGLYNLMRNLGGAIGLAVANTLTLQWQKMHYAHVRESLTAGSTQVMQTWQKMSALGSAHQLPQPTTGALAQLHALVWREASVMTTNQLFQLMAMLFLASLFLMPLVKKFDMGQAPGGH